MSNKLLKIFAFVFLIANMARGQPDINIDANEGQGQPDINIDANEGQGRSGIKINANVGQMTVIAKIEDLIVVDFPKNVELHLLENNGDATAEGARTFEFQVKRLTAAGAKLKLCINKEGDIFFDPNKQTWSILRKNSDETKDTFNLEFYLKAPSNSNNGEEYQPRKWESDNEGYYYAFKREDPVGRWCIVAKLQTSIEKQRSGEFRAELKTVVVAD